MVTRTVTTLWEF